MHPNAEDVGIHRCMESIDESIPNPLMNKYRCLIHYLMDKVDELEDRIMDLEDGK